MTTVAQLTALTSAMHATSQTMSDVMAQVASLEVAPEDLRAELDGVNTELDALKGARDIVLAIARDEATIPVDRLALIVQTLEQPQ